MGVSDPNQSIWKASSIERAIPVTSRPRQKLLIKAILLLPPSHLIGFDAKRDPITTSNRPSLCHSLQKLTCHPHTRAYVLTCTGIP